MMSALADRTTRWTIAVLVVVAALAAALVLALRESSSPPGVSVSSGPLTGGREHRDADTRRRWPGPAARRSPALPAATGTPESGALRGVVVECAADGALVDVAQSLAGRRVVLNLWAYWCGPCATELPAMAEYQRRAGPRSRW
ncbi:ahpC/TSA family protein [Mycobacterium xenopi 3993]|nr:ahpC/TSA family protein [Mycobacterium xenopi 3993]